MPKHTLPSSGPGLPVTVWREGLLTFSIEGPTPFLNKTKIFVAPLQMHPEKPYADLSCWVEVSETPGLIQICEVIIKRPLKAFTWSRVNYMLLYMAQIYWKNNGLLTCKNTFVLVTWFPEPSQPVQIHQLAKGVKQRLSLHSSDCPVHTDKPCQGSQAHHADSWCCQVSGWHWICGCRAFSEPLHLRKNYFELLSC